MLESFRPRSSYLKQPSCPPPPLAAPAHFTLNRGRALTVSRRRCSLIATRLTFLMSTFVYAARRHSETECGVAGRSHRLGEHPGGRGRATPPDQTRRLVGQQSGWLQTSAAIFRAPTKRRLTSSQLTFAMKASTYFAAAEP